MFSRHSHRETRAAAPVVDPALKLKYDDAVGRVFLQCMGLPVVRARHRSREAVADAIAVVAKRDTQIANDFTGRQFVTKEVTRQLLGK